MAQTAEDAAYAKVAGRPLKSFLLGLTAGGWGAIVLNSALSKVSHTFLEAFVLGVLCNLMVCLAIWAAFSGRTTTDTIPPQWRRCVG